MRAGGTWWRRALGAVVLAAVVAACSSGGGDDEGAASTSSTPTRVGGGREVPAGGVPAPATPGLSCGGGAVAGYRTGPGAELGTPVRIMPLGDSITVGMHGTDADWIANKSLRGGYRARLQELLDGAAVSYEMVGASDAVDFREELPCQAHEGHGGWCIRGGEGTCPADFYVPGGDAGLIGQVGSWFEVARPDVVLLHIGTNDLNAGHDPEVAASDLADLVDEMLAAQPGVYVFVSSLYLEGTDVDDEFNERARDVVDAAARRHPGQVFFVDTYVDAPEPVTGDDENGLHPSLEAYEVMGERWFDALWAALPGLFPTGPAPEGAATPDQAATPPAQPDVQPVGQIPSAGTFRLVAQEEFDEDRLDTSVWNVGPPWGTQFCQGRELFIDEGFDVSDGLLRIFFTRRDEPVDFCGIERTYNTAMLQTKGKLTVRSGQFLEFRVRAARGDGLLSVAWVLPESWPDESCTVQQFELDVFEHLGRDPGRVNQAAHVRGDCENLDRDESFVVSPGAKDFTTSFHVVGVDWQPDQVVFYVDGVETFRSSKFGGHDEPGFVLVNGFLGRHDDHWAGPESDSTPDVAEFQVDYVRVWERA